MTALKLVSTFHQNAVACRLDREVIDFLPMAEVARASSAIFSKVDRDDVVQRRAARDAWLLKSSLSQTALPFNDGRLALDALLKNLEDVAQSLPSIRAAVSDLAGLVRSLTSANRNPKRERILELLACRHYSDGTLAILANICGSPTPGWPIGMETRIDLGDEDVELIRIRRQVRNSLFSKLIIPGNPWYAPEGLVLDLLYGGRASEVVLVTYRSERTSVPAPKKFPKDTRFNSVGSQFDCQPRAIDQSEEIQLDRWVNQNSWLSIHAQHVDLTPKTEKDLTVGARFVLFADGSGTFFPEDGRVVEVSELFEAGANLVDDGHKLPRTSVEELGEGDLVMLRLSGSGDYLDEVVDSLLEQTGNLSLRSNALEWKHRLHEVIKRHGEGVVAMKARSLGIKLSSPQYLWVWAGDAVMAPQDRKTFFSLIRAIWQLESRENDEDSEAYAEARWSEMDRLKGYHQRAGSAIRAALLSRVRDIVRERRRIDLVESIELPGVTSGRMGLLRVAAVDIKPMQVPSSKLFQLSKFKVT